MQRALAALPLGQRQVLVLQDLGLGVDAIAEQLGIPSGTVKSRLSRARTALAPLLREKPTTMSDLHLAIEAQREAFRPVDVPPFSSLQVRRRLQDRRVAAAGAAVSVVAVAGLLVSVSLLGDGPDTVRSTPAAPAPADDERTRFGEALATADDLARDHVAGPISYPDYPARPPMGGEPQPAAAAVRRLRRAGPDRARGALSRARRCLGDLSP